MGGVSSHHMAARRQPSPMLQLPGTTIAPTFEVSLLNRDADCVELRVQVQNNDADRSLHYFEWQLRDEYPSNHTQFWYSLLNEDGAVVPFAVKILYDHKFVPGVENLREIGPGKKAVSVLLGRGDLKAGNYIFSCFLSNFESTWHSEPRPFEVIAPRGTRAPPTITVSVVTAFVDDVQLRFEVQNNDPLLPLQHMCWQATDQLPSANYMVWYDVVDARGKRLPPTRPVKMVSRSPFRESELVDIGPGERKTATLKISDWFLLKPGDYTFSCHLSDLKSQWPSTGFSFRVAGPPKI